MMRLCAIFLILNIHLCHIFAAPPSPLELSSQPNHNLLGYKCGKVSFHDTVLEESAQAAQQEGRNAIKGRYPTAYSGPPFHQQCLIWPIFQDGSLFRTGNKGLYHLILTPDYKVMSVAMFIKGKFKVCDRTMMAKKNHDTSDYDCYGRRFSHQQLVAAAKKACVKMNTETRNSYPARYEGSGFEIDGPYYTYPIFEGNSIREFKYGPGLYRVVINENCEVAGALEMLYLNRDERFLARLRKCHRLEDGPLPPGFINNNAGPIFEHKIRH